MADNISNQYTPDYVSMPGETLAELLEERQMTRNELAQRTGLAVNTITEIIHGREAITPETALQFERVLDVPAALWLGLEKTYREYIARKKIVA